MIAIVDYGVGNLGSILNMFRRIGSEADLATTESDLASAVGIVLPGVGSFDRGMMNLKESGLLPLIEKRVWDDGLPLLGVCLGMQLLTNGSDEGTEPGLGWIDAHSYRFDPPEGLKVPHMGWNRLNVLEESPLFAGIEDPQFYFLHSFYVGCRDRSQAIAQTTYGQIFDSAVCRENVFGVQFHPEKSHRFGMQLFRNFVNLTG